MFQMFHIIFTPLWGVLPKAKRPEGRAARGRPGNVWQALSDPTKLGEKRKLRAARGSGITLPNLNQVLTHAERAAAKQLNDFRHL